MTTSKGMYVCICKRFDSFIYALLKVHVEKKADRVSTKIC